MPSHEQTPVDPHRRAGLLAILAGGLLMVPDNRAWSAPKAMPQVPPAAAEAVDWDHFGEPMLSAARRANVQVTRRLHQRAGHAGPVDMLLYKLPGDWTWERVRTHYVGGAPVGWQAVADKNSRVETGNPAQQQTFVSTEHADQPFAIVWLPAGPEVHDSLLMVLRLAQRRR